MSTEDILGSFCGFLTVIIAIFLLNAFKELDIHYGNIRYMLRPKREILSTNNTQWNCRDEERLITRLEAELEHTYGA